MNKKSKNYKKMKKVKNDNKSFEKKLERKDFKKQLNKDKVMLKKIVKLALEKQKWKPVWVKWYNMLEQIKDATK